MNAVKTLELNYNRNSAFELMTEVADETDGFSNAGYFGDNGGDSDGNLDLPSEPLDESDKGVREVLEAGYGKIVRAFYYEDLDEITRVIESYGFTSPRMFAEQDEREDIEYNDVRDALQAAVDEDKIHGFAGYGSSDTFAVIWKR